MRRGQTGRSFAATALVLALLATTFATCAAQEPAYFNTHILAQRDWLETNLDNPGLVLIDFGRAQEEYEAGHIPGAVFVERRDLSRVVNGVPSMLAAPDSVATVLRRAGVNSTSTIVIYDAGAGLMASRLFWAAEYAGHCDVRVLNGGYSMWTEDGRAIDAGRETPPAGDFEAHVRSLRMGTKEWILERLDSVNLAVVDARGSGEYTGDDLMATRGGHIPGAVNVNWVENLLQDGSDEFLSPADLRALYENAGVTPDLEVVTYCQAGVRAAHSYFALRLLGYPCVRVYDASWIEWGNDPGTPITVGFEAE